MGIWHEECVDTAQGSAGVDTMLMRNGGEVVVDSREKVGVIKTEGEDELW